MSRLAVDGYFMYSYGTLVFSPPSYRMVYGVSRGKTFASSGKVGDCREEALVFLSFIFPRQTENDHDGGC